MISSVSSPLLAALGLVIMQASIAFSGFGAVVRIGILVLGISLVILAAAVSATSLARPMVMQVTLILFCGAMAFEALSAFNGHLVFGAKAMVFRLVCYTLVITGVLIGLDNGNLRTGVSSNRILTLAVMLIAVTAPITWVSLQSATLTDATRGSFDDSSPVALGFSSGTLAIAALAVVLRSPRAVDLFLGAAGFGMWAIVCLQSGSRGGLLSLALATLLLCVLSFQFAPKRVLAVLLLATMVVTGRLALSDAVANQASFVLDRFEGMLTFEADASIAGSADSRAYLLEYNLNLPGLFMLGGEGFDPEAYPHNFEVEAFVRLGVPLGILFLAAVIYLLGSGIRSLFSRELNLGVGIILSMGLFTFFNAQTNMMWEFLRPLWLSLGLAAGMSIAQRAKAASC